MKYALRIFFVFGAIFVLGAASSRASMSCDKDSFLIKTETGRWGYGQITCSVSGVDGLDAIYEGNLSDKIEARVTKKAGTEYLIELILDASSAEKAAFKGKVELLTDLGGNLTTFPATVRIGQEDVNEITLSEDNLRFTFDRTNYEECHTVEVANTGDTDLDSLEAKITSWETHKNNQTWITINDISTDTFRKGKKKDLEICVNNADNKTGTRQATVRVSAGDVLQEIKATLTQDVDSELQKKYDLLRYQYDFLQKSYNQVRIYQDKAEELNRTYYSLLSNYTELSANYSNVSLKLSKLENVSRTTTTISTTTTTVNTPTTLETVSTTVPSDGLSAEDAAMIEALKKKKEESQATQENNTNSTASTNILGYAVSLGEPTLYAGIGIPILFILILGVALFRKVVKNRGRKAAAKPAPAAVSTSEAPVTTPEDKTREQQKEALRQLLMQKLAEKAGEKK